MYILTKLQLFTVKVVKLACFTANLEMESIYPDLNQVLHPSQPCVPTTRLTHTTQKSQAPSFFLFLEFAVKQTSLTSLSGEKLVSSVDDLQHESHVLRTQMILWYGLRTLMQQSAVLHAVLLHVVSQPRPSYCSHICMFSHVPLVTCNLQKIWLVVTLMLHMLPQPGIGTK